MEAVVARAIAFARDEQASQRPPAPASPRAHGGDGGADDGGPVGLDGGGCWRAGSGAPEAPGRARAAPDPPSRLVVAPAPPQKAPERPEVDGGVRGDGSLPTE